MTKAIRTRTGEPANDNAPGLEDMGAALYVTSRNCAAVVGLPWETTLALAQRHEVEIIVLGPRRKVIPAAELARALRAEHERLQPARPLTEDEQLDRLLATVGLERNL